MSTQLTYVIRTTPNPLTAGAANASVTLLATNETDKAISLEGISIGIPVGTEADDLTNLPGQIVADYPKVWKENPPNTSKPGVYKIIFAPESGTIPVAPHSSLTFVLNKIAINSVDGTVDLSITEGSVGQPTQVISASKFPKSWGEVSFSAQPPDLAAAGDVTLKWDGPTGATYTIEYLDLAKRKIVNIPMAGQAPLANSGSYPGPNEPPLSINATTVFTLTVSEVISGKTYSTQAQQTVTVNVAPKIISFTGKIEGEWPDRKLLLNWKTTHADLVDPSWGNEDTKPANPEEPIQILPPFLPTYTIKAVNGSGLESKLAEVQMRWEHLTTIPVEQSPGSIAISPDGKYAFVANLLSNTVTVIAIREENMPVVKNITVGQYPTAIAITPGGEYAMVSSTGPSSVAVIAIQEKNMRVVKNINIPGVPFTIAFTPDNKYALVVDMDSKTVSVIDMAKMTVQSTIKVGQSPNSIAISPDGKYALVVNSEGIVSVIDMEEMRVQNTIKLGQGSQSIAISSNGEYALVGKDYSNMVSVIDMAKMAVQNTITVGQAPASIAISPDGKYALAVNFDSQTVSVIDTAKMAVQNTIKIRQGPQSLAISPNGGYALVSNGSNTVSILVLGSPAPSSKST
ncbi:MAG: cytochrome D1 domain-containing protein [Bacteroidota bacterium]